MSLAADIIIAAAICAAVFGLLWVAKGVLLTPIITGKDVHMMVILKLTGDGKNAEQVINSLLWLKRGGNTDMQIVIDGSRANSDAEKRAHLISKKHEEIILRGFNSEGDAWKETDSST